MFEPKKFEVTLFTKLTAKGYNINLKNPPVLGKVDAILVLPNKQLQGGADSRGDDAAVGF